MHAYMHLEMRVLWSVLMEPYSHFAVRPGRDGKHCLHKAEEEKSAHQQINAPDSREEVCVSACLCERESLLLWGS